MKKFLIPVVAGIAVFGGVTAFAATLTVNSDTLGAGNAAVNSCNASATVKYNVARVAGAYNVSTAPVASGATCVGMSYKVTLTGASGDLGEVSGTLTAVGSPATSSAASPDFASAAVPAASVTGVSVVITG